MKKYYLFIAIPIALLLSSCTTSRPTISTDSYRSELHYVNSTIESLGYNLSGTSSDKKNEVYVYATSYSTQTGYGTAMNNNYYWYDTYRFTDSTNNTVSYKVKYKYGKDNKDEYYVENVSVVECDCTKEKDYERACGRYGVVKNLNFIKNDQTSTFSDDAGTVLLVTSLLLAAEVVVLLLLL
ncbi:MAG: hypothetical protein II878_04525 [Bacteroidales bacterium]|nr:hypothetical protein [Bacteroidales bacterium]